MNYSADGHEVPGALPVRLRAGERQEGRPDVRPAHAGRPHGRTASAPRSCRTACSSAAARRRRSASGIIEDDLLEAVIGLAPQPLLRHRHPGLHPRPARHGPKPAERRGKVLFINADREFTAGRAQNTCAASTSRRSSPPTRSIADIPGFARVVDIQRTARERLQPQHPPVRGQHPAARTPGRPRPPDGRSGRGRRSGRTKKAKLWGRTGSDPGAVCSSVRPIRTGPSRPMWTSSRGPSAGRGARLTALAESRERELWSRSTGGGPLEDGEQIGLPRAVRR